MNLRDMYLYKNFGPQASGGGGSGSGASNFWEDLWQGAETIISDEELTLASVGQMRNTTIRFECPNVVAPSAMFQQAKKITHFQAKGIDGQGNYAFQNCATLIYADIGVIRFFGGWLFQNCTNLETVKCKPTQPWGSAIYSNHFTNCKKLTTFVVDCNFVPSIGTDLLKTTPIAPSGDATDIEYGTGYVYVRKALLEEFKAATNWAVYADQFRAIEDYPDICGEVTA